MHTNVEQIWTQNRFHDTHTKNTNICEIPDKVCGGERGLLVIYGYITVLQESIKLIRYRQCYHSYTQVRMQLKLDRRGKTPCD